MHISKGHRVDNCVRTRADRSRQGAKLVAIEYDEPCAPSDQIIGRWATASVGQSHFPAICEKLVADRPADLACATYDECASSHESKFVAGQSGQSQLHLQLIGAAFWREAECQITTRLGPCVLRRPSTAQR